MAKKNTVEVNKYFLATVASVVLVAGLVCASLLGYYFRYLRRAHSTFENYYAFRGCSKLIEKTDTFGVCQLPDGSKLKLVLFNNRWYLDGDLPVCYFGVCF